MSKIIRPMGPAVKRLTVEFDAANQTRIKVEKLTPAGMQQVPVLETEIMLVMLNLLGAITNGLHLRVTQGNNAMTVIGGNGAEKAEN